jgi:hypothetical protein
MTKPRTLIAALLSIAIVFSLSAAVSAVTLTQNFRASEQLAKGTIISLDKQASAVTRSNGKNITNMYGVVVESGDISFFTQAEHQNDATVSNSGVVLTLVSNATGDIEVGDPITVNGIAGIGQKATVSGRILGVAQSAFSDKSPNAKQFEVDQNGSKKNIKVGLIPVRISVSDYTTSTSALDLKDEQNRNKIEQIADSLAGKIVKPIALIISGLILISGVFISTFLITSSSYASMVSIGRNPLSEKKIIRSLIGLIALSIGIFCASLLLSYLTLKILG